MDNSPIPLKTTLQGDNLPILRSMPPASIDLIYLDPPYNSNAHYGEFSDVHRWTDATANAWRLDLLNLPYPERKKTAVLALFDYLHATEQPSLMAYTAFLTPRLIALHGLLKPTGSLYLQCDYHANAPVRLVLDVVFGTANFRNEIVWQYRTGGYSKRWFSRKHDTIFYYARSSEQGRLYRVAPKNGKDYIYYLSEGVSVTDVWHIKALNPQAHERTGYPTQKPLALLERIIQASSNPGEIVLDPFCGSGTTLVAAQYLGREWIGINANPNALAIARERLAGV